MAILTQAIAAPYDETVPIYTRSALAAAYPYLQEIRVRAVDMIDGPIDGLLVASVAPMLGAMPLNTGRVFVAAFRWACELEDGVSCWAPLFSAEGFPRPSGECRHAWFGYETGDEAGYLHDLDGTTRKVMIEALKALGKWFD